MFLGNISCYESCWQQIMYHYHYEKKKKRQVTMNELQTTHGLRLLGPTKILKVAKSCQIIAKSVTIRKIFCINRLTAVSFLSFIKRNLSN